LFADEARPGLPYTNTVLCVSYSTCLTGLSRFRGRGTCVNPEGPYVLEQFVSVPPLFMQTSEESIYFETSAFIFRKL